jgi:hypothetical protein
MPMTTPSPAPPQPTPDVMRRGLLFAPLAAALPFGLVSTPAAAIDRSQTQVTLFNQYQWKAWTGGPPHSAEIAVLHGSLDQPGTSMSC